MSDTPNPQTDPSLDPSQLGDVDQNKAPAANPAVDPGPKAKEPQPEAKTEEAKEAKSKEDAGSPGTEEDGGNADDPSNDDTPLNNDVWGESGSETGDAVLTLLQNSGIDPKDAKDIMWDAVLAGKPEDIDMAKLTEKVGKTRAHLIMTGVKAYIGEAVKTAENTAKTVHEAVGGKDNWTAVSEWAKSNLPAEERAELKEMIDAGGIKAKMAAKHLKEQYEAADGNSTLDVKEEVPSSRTPSETAKLEPLTARSYSTKLEALHNAYQGNPPAHLRQQLLNARNAGKRAGI